MVIVKIARTAEAAKALQRNRFLILRNPEGGLYMHAPARPEVRQGVIPTPEFPEDTQYGCVPSGNGNYALW